MNNPLLSIIIPTKNRQLTALFAVKTALTIPSNNIEIIVQDCSADDRLGADLEKLQDHRIRYFFQNDPVSMTENWNRAYGQASGDYQIGIGDDDAVFPEIYAIAEWAASKGYEAVGQTEPYKYYWPNFPHQHARRRLFLHPFAGTVKVIDDVYSRVIERSRYCDDGYGIDLPMVYHRLISKGLLNKLKTVTGKLLDGTSLDVYSSFAIGLLCGRYVVVDYPFSMRGASGESNSGRFVVKKDKEHFDEFKYVSYPEWLPRIPLVHVSIAESIYKAFVQTNHEDLVANIDLAYLYAACLVDRPGKRPYLAGFVKKYLKTPEQKAAFRRFVIRMARKKIDRTMRIAAENVNQYIPVLTLYRKLIKKKVILLDDTMEVLAFHASYVQEHHISLKLG